MFKTGHTHFDKLLEKATSNLLLEPDWEAIMNICDLIRQKDCQPKYAVNGIKRKLASPNPHVVMFALQVLESAVKNCGNPMHDEVATREFMEVLRDLVKTSHHENVKEKILELLLTWAHAFRKIPSYRAVQDVVNIMRAEGTTFKPLLESDAMFVADTAPEWADGDCCHRCRTEFGLVNRKHHCRACGQIFCGKCSSKVCTLPRFGIEKEVRVCDSCFDKYAKEGSTSDPEELIMRATQQSRPAVQPQQQGQGPRTKTEEELAEEEQLQLALAISQSEAEAKEMEAKRRTTTSSYSAYNQDISAPTGSQVEKDKEKSSPQKTADSEDPELARYLNRGYWENRSKEENTKEETGGSIASKAGGSSSSSEKSSIKTWNSGYSFMPSAPIKESRDRPEQPEEIDCFGENLRNQIEMFVNRMKSNSSRGRPIAYDTSVQGLFMNITALHSQLLNFIQAQDNARTYYEGLQDKLGQIRDARAALDDLRFEHREKIRLEAEEQERIRQFQMAQKLQIMRQKKAEYIQYQRQLAMQRMQDQEREMQMRIEQQARQGVQNHIPFSGYQSSPGAPNMPGAAPAMWPSYYPPNPNAPMPQMSQGQPNPYQQQMPGAVSSYTNMMSPNQQGYQHQPQPAHGTPSTADISRDPNISSNQPYNNMHHQPQQQQHGTPVSGNGTPTMSSNQAYQMQQQQPHPHHVALPVGTPVTSDPNLSSNQPHQQQQQQQQPLQHATTIGTPTSSNTNLATNQPYQQPLHHVTTIGTPTSSNTNLTTNQPYQQQQQQPQPLQQTTMATPATSDTNLSSNQSQPFQQQQPPQQQQPQQVATSIGTPTPTTMDSNVTQPFQQQQPQDVKPPVSTPTTSDHNLSSNQSHPQPPQQVTTPVSVPATSSTSDPTLTSNQPNQQNETTSVGNPTTSEQNLIDII